MMNTTILACSVIKKELLHVMKTEGIDLPVVWLESGLHDYPKKLHEALRDAIADITTKRIIVTYGFCGERR